MSPAQTTLRLCREDARDLLVMTDDRAQKLVAPVFHEIRELRALGVPEHKVKALIGALRLCCTFNDEMRLKAQEITERLDELARRSHRAQPTVKHLALALRPHLALIAEPEKHDGIAYVTAVRALRNLIDATPFDRLAGGGMRRALGPGRHALLMSFVDGQAEPLIQHTMPIKAPTLGRAGGETTGSTCPPEAGGLATSLKAVA